jgi:hypothetical protein
MGRTKQTCTQEVDTGMKIEYNKCYDFTINASFGDLPKSVIEEILKDGRLSSHFLERQLEVWFPELTFVNAKGYDHIRADSDILYDQKCFTKGGLGFAPSKMLGAGRHIDLEEAHAHANTIHYIACDIVDFPKVRVRFISGKDLIEKYPGKRCKVPFAERESFFTVDNG